MQRNLFLQRRPDSPATVATLTTKRQHEHSQNDSFKANYRISSSTVWPRPEQINKKVECNQKLCQPTPREESHPNQMQCSWSEPVGKIPELSDSSKKTHTRKAKAWIDKHEATRRGLKYASRDGAQTTPRRRINLAPHL
jgi:hypothetical protein